MTKNFTIKETFAHNMAKHRFMIFLNGEYVTCAITKQMAERRVTAFQKNDYSIFQYSDRINDILAGKKFSAPIYN